MTTRTSTAPLPVLAAIAQTRNGWMASYAYVSHQLAQAVVAGKVTEADLLAIDTTSRAAAQAFGPSGPVRHPGEGAGDGYEALRLLADAACIKVADAAGLPWDSTVALGGYRAHIDGDSLDVAAASLLALAAGAVDLDTDDASGAWSIYSETLEEVGTTYAAVRDAVRGDLVRACQVIVDADAEPSLLQYRK